MNGIWRVRKIKLLGFTVKYLKGQLVNFTLYLIMSIAISIIGIIVPFITGNFIDTLIIAEDTDFIWTIGFILASLNVLLIILLFVAGISHSKTLLDSSFTLSKRLIEHIHGAKYTNYSQTDSAYLNNRISQDAGVVTSFTISTIAGILINSLTLLVTLLMILSISLAVTLILVGFLLLYVTIYLLLRKPLYNRSFALQEQRNYFHAKMLEQVQHSKFVKAHGIKKFFSKRLTDSFSLYKNVFLPFQYMSLLYSGLDKTILNLSQVTLLFIGGYQIVRGNLTIGQFTILSGYFASILYSLSFYFSIGASYQKAMVSYTRVLEIFKWENEQNLNGKTCNIDSIEANNLSFSYLNKEIFNNVNFRIEKGNIYALLGQNGAGKSTLINVILGLLEDSYSGEIYINEFPYYSYNLELMRQNNIGVVEQEPVILQDSLINNILLGKPLSREVNDKLYELINILSMENFIATLPNGLQTIISKESNFSGGEKQKIAIMRVLLADKELILFDEPTASLDIIATKKLLEYLSELKHSKIMIIVSHDKSVISFCDGLLNI